MAALMLNTTATLIPGQVSRGQEAGMVTETVRGHARLSGIDPGPDREATRRVNEAAAALKNPQASLFQVLLLIGRYKGPHNGTNSADNRGLTWSFP